MNAHATRPAKPRAPLLRLVAAFALCASTMGANGMGCGEGLQNRPGEPGLDVGGINGATWAMTYNPQIEVTVKGAHFIQLCDKNKTPPMPAMTTTAPGARLAPMRRSGIDAGGTVAPRRHGQRHRCSVPRCAAHKTASLPPWRRCKSSRCH